MMHQAQLLLLVTGECNMACPHCAQGWWRRDYKDYHMSLEEISLLCKRVDELGLHFGQAMVMGGEPALWKNLGEGCHVLHESGVFDKVYVYSNCKNPLPIMSVLDKGWADKVVVQTVNMSDIGVACLVNNHPDKVSVTQQPEHWVHPDTLLDGVLPAACGCDQITVFDYKVYSCPGAYHNTKRFGLDVDNPPLWMDLQEDWKTFFDRMDRYNIQACRGCLANGKLGKSNVVGSRRGDLK